MGTSEEQTAVAVLFVSAMPVAVFAVLFFAPTTQTLMPLEEQRAASVVGSGHLGVAPLNQEPLTDIAVNLECDCSCLVCGENLTAGPAVPLLSSSDASTGMKKEHGHSAESKIRRKEAKKRRRAGSRM